MTPQPLAPGDRITTPSGRHGRIVRSPWLMPHHCLIAFDEGRLLWIPQEILCLETLVSSTQCRKKKAAYNVPRKLDRGIR
jgi:hypothetical protein